VRPFIGIVILSILLPALAWAQDKDKQYRGEGYLFLGLGEWSDGSGRYGLEHVGGGGEVLLFKGLGIEEELGAMGRPGGGVGLFSVDPVYNFRHVRKDPKLVPFVEAGYTRAFGNRGFTITENMFNFGGGFHYWLFKHVGLRLELRDYLAHTSWGYWTGPQRFGETRNYPAIRIGLAIRP